MPDPQLKPTVHKRGPAAPSTPDPIAAVPAAREVRERLRAAVHDYVASRRPVPPFSVDELRFHSEQVMAVAGVEDQFRKYTAVLLSNEAWRGKVAAVPMDRRLLLLPKCLRSDADCPAPVDEMGLACAGCGRCSIAGLKAEAEELGYIVLVAEGTALVMSLLRSHQIEAVIGVSCMAALEGIYPLMEAAAVPGIAFPLLADGCVNTTTDLDWVREAIHMEAAATSRRLNIDALRAQVEQWFAPLALEALLGPSSGETEGIARAWLAKSGKRWRPLLVACVYQALRGTPELPLPDDIRRLALAVECFHKASLVHDDIEDGDDRRYGQLTLHAQYGTPVALNVGDLLLGEGYRLIAECGAPAEQKTEMLRAAAHGHRDLTIGQGSELCWARRPQPLSTAEVIDIFRLKTAPAFEVALRLGAIAAGATADVPDVLRRYSEALGIAYQISDDLKDYEGDDDPSDVLAMRPSILMAIAHDRAQGDDRRFFDAVWRRSPPETDAPATIADEIRRRSDALGVCPEARRLLAVYEETATRSLEPLAGPDLKALLRRVLYKIFNAHSGEVPPDEPEAPDAAGRPTGPTPQA
jgi:geranylgeranyl pyrophosphate synthase